MMAKMGENQKLDELQKAQRIQIRDFLTEEKETRAIQTLITEMLCKSERRNHILKTRLEKCSGDIGEEAIRAMVPIVWESIVRVTGLENSN